VLLCCLKVRVSGDSDDDDLFPFGLWDVEGLPVVVQKTRGGGARVFVVREDGTTDPFPVTDIERKGVKLTAEEFAEAFPFARKYAGT
jgi:hypothetical protein